MSTAPDTKQPSDALIALRQKFPAAGLQLQYEPKADCRRCKGSGVTYGAYPCLCLFYGPHTEIAARWMRGEISHDTFMALKTTIPNRIPRTATP